MQSSGDEVEVLLRESAVGFLGAEHSLDRLRRLRAEPDGCDRLVWKKMAELGWLGLRLPERLGGAGLGLKHAAGLAQVLGSGCVPEPFVFSGLMPSVVLDAVAETPRVKALAALLREGGGHVSLAWQDGINDIEPRFQGTVARRRGGSLKLRGSKLFVPMPSAVFLLSARLDGAPVIIAVPSESAGVAVTSCRMADGGICADIGFDDTVVESDAILAEGIAAENAIRLAIAEGTVALSAQLCGLAEQALSITLKYLCDRVQFDRPIGSFQALQHRAVDLRIGTDLAGASWRNAVRLLERERRPHLVENAVNAAKARCSEVALKVCRDAIQLHGAIGYTDEAAIGLYLKMALRLASSLGNAAAHRRHFAITTRGSKTA